MKKTQIAEERYPIIEEGSEILPLPDATSAFHWSPSQAMAFEEAATGSQSAWAALYRMAAAFIRQGEPIPQPLATLMADRLQAIADTLSDPREKDKRAALPDAVLTSARRLQGRKSKDFHRQMAAEVLLLAMSHALPHDLMQHVAKMLTAVPGEVLTLAARITSTKDLDTAIAYMVEKKLTEIPANTLRTNARKLRNTLKEAE